MFFFRDFGMESPAGSRDGALVLSVGDKADGFGNFFDTFGTKSDHSVSFQEVEK